MEILTARVVTTTADGESTEYEGLGFDPQHKRYIGTVLKKDPPTRAEQLALQFAFDVGSNVTALELATAFAPDSGSTVKTIRFSGTGTTAGTDAAPSLGNYQVGKARQAVEWWKSKYSFTDRDGATRELFYETDSARARLHISLPRGEMQTFHTPPTLAEYLKTLKQVVSTAPDRQCLKEIEGFAQDINEVKRESDGSFSAARGELIHVYFNEIALRLNAIAGIGTPPATVVSCDTASIYNEEHGARMVAHPLSIDPGGHIGSKPVSSSTKLWEKVRTIMRGNDTAYIKGHLLNHHLHGPGTWKNMVPIARSTNSEMERIAEGKVKHAVVSQNRVLHYEVTMVFDPPPSGGSPAERKLPREITMEAHELKYRRGKWGEKGTRSCRRKRSATPWPTPM